MKNSHFQLLTVADILLLCLPTFFLVITLWQIVSTTCSSTEKYLLATRTQNYRRGTDFAKYYCQGYLAAHNPSRLYDTQTQGKWLLGLADNQSADPKNFCASEYTPPLCVAMIPFTALPIEKSYGVWMILQIAFASTIIYFFGKKVKRNWQITDWVYFAIIILGSTVFSANAMVGQTSLFMIGFLSLFFSGLYQNRSLLGGVPLALAAIFKPQHCLIPIVMALCNRRWNILGVFVLTSTLLYCCSAFILGWQTIIDYPTFLDRFNTAIYSDQFFSLRPVCINIYALLSYFLPSSQTRIIGYLLTITSVILSYYIWRKALQIGKHSYGLALLSTMALALVLNLHSNYNDLLILAIPWCLVVSRIGFSKLNLIDSAKDRWWSIGFLVFWLGEALLLLIFGIQSIHWNVAILTILALVSWLQLLQGNRSPAEAKDNFDTSK